RELVNTTRELLARSSRISPRLLPSRSIFNAWRVEKTISSDDLETLRSNRLLTFPWMMPIVEGAYFEGIGRSDLALERYRACLRVLPGWLQESSTVRSKVRALNGAPR